MSGSATSSSGGQPGRSERLVKDRPLVGGVAAAALADGGGLAVVGPAVSEAGVEESDPGHSLALVRTADRARAVVRGVGRVSGQAVAILASNADRDGGRLCENDCRNAARLLRFANRFQIPVLAVQDSIGVEGSEGFADAFDELLGEWMHLTVPAITLIVGRAYGLAHVALGGTGAKPSAILAWPRARVSLDVPEGDDPRSAAIAVARGFGVHEIIDPRRTRETVGEWLSLWQDRSAG
jgi:hypothetical protein